MFYKHRILLDFSSNIPINQRGATFKTNKSAKSQDIFMHISGAVIARLRSPMRSMGECFKTVPKKQQHIDLPPQRPGGCSV